MTPLRIQRRRTKGWRMPPSTVSVARPGQWGNPHRVGADETYYGGPGFENATPKQCVALYQGHIKALIEIEGWGVLTPLRGKNLACWCKLCDRHKDGKPFDVDCPDCEPCHADVLGRLANGLTCEAVQGE